ncbi:TIGR00341 family protein [Roseovarius faecimaris]|uniref:TIGR00341 family protein n=1 Tax=Roseovarius faecimaris TaxID=2494550 RepID=A0A6I6IMU1_9RHOB|nr:TIGR00341 family protein [Roseovarius faecimaris]QGX97404.1 TIGR00341 family protein [Roseovarius faecimaris]
MRQIIVSAPEAEMEHIIRRAERLGAVDIQVHRELQEADRISVHILTDRPTRQELTDGLQSVLNGVEDWRITMLPVETTIPRPDEDKLREEPKRAGGATREEIYNIVGPQARADSTYLIFVVLSTVVAALGMLTDSVAVVVGAMVIAPLLGPNLALAVGVALGDGGLIGRAITTNIVGVGLALALSFGIGLWWPVNLQSSELLARSTVGFDGMAIALASGAAAALSLATGVSSALVGVMVAVALLPPTAAIGLFLGAGQSTLAMGAALLLAVNVVCINLSAQVVMVARGITPRSFFERKRARRATWINGLIWFGLLAALGALMWYRTPVAV